ncbi:MAG: N-acetyltransferase [Hyphomonadaceae bacterium]|nr:N-acetyltransferase [Hyphomonadaceae bacterium]
MAAPSPPAPATSTLPPAPAGEYRIVEETAAHAAALEGVLDRAFGPGRFAKTSERVRERGAAHRLNLSRVALFEGAAVGVCRMSDISVGGRSALFLGPLAVDPPHQHARLGGRLVAAALEAVKGEGKPVLVVGAASFFQPFGFARIPDGRVAMPGPVDPSRFLWLSQTHGGLEGLGGMVGPALAA